MGCSPWGRKESDMTERLHYYYFTSTPLGEGDGTPLQYSCLENPMGGGAWQAAVHGVTELDTTEQLHFHFHTTKILIKVISEFQVARYHDQFSPLMTSL